MADAVLLGVRYDGETQKRIYQHAYYRGSLMQYALPLALLYAIGGWILGMIVGIVIGMGQSSVPPVLGLLGGLGVAWYSAFRFRADYLAAKVDP